MISPPQAYFEEAERVGALHFVDGRRIVAARNYDVIRQKNVFYVEHCDGLADISAEDFAAFDAWCSQNSQDADIVQLRAGPLPLNDPKWAPWSRYVVATQRARDYYGTLATPPGLALREATGLEYPAVRHMLETSCTDGYLKQEVTPAISQAVSQIMDDPTRRSWVATHRDRIVGHLTVVDDHDDVTDVTFRHIVDTYVCKGESMRILENLVAHCMPHLVKPVLASIIAESPERSDAILRGLTSKGWALHHAYWIRPA